MIFLSTALINIHERFACNVTTTSPSVRGLYCGHYNIRNIGHAPRHECTIECMRSSMCYVLSYNNVHNYCLIGSHPCSKMQENDNFEMQVIKGERLENCVRWTDNQTAFQPHRVQYGTNARPMTVVYIKERNNILTGKCNQFSSVAYTAINVAIRSDHWQVLLIDEGCATTWLPYDPLSEPLPTNVM